MVKKNLSEIDVKKSIGFDQIPSKILRLAHKILPANTFVHMGVCSSRVRTLTLF